MTPQQLVEARLEQSRLTQIQKTVASIQIQPSEYAGSYAGHDCKTGQDLVTLASGGTVKTNTVSSSMATPGEKINFAVPASGEAYNDRL